MDLAALIVLCGCVFASTAALHQQERCWRTLAAASDAAPGFAAPPAAAVGPAATATDSGDNSDRGGGVRGEDAALLLRATRDRDPEALCEVALRFYNGDLSAGGSDGAAMAVRMWRRAAAEGPPSPILCERRCIDGPDKPWILILCCVIL